MRRTHVLIAVITLIFAACGQATRTTAATPAPPPPRPAAPLPATPGPGIALVRTTSGVAGVVEGASDVAWSVDHGVAALDGSAVFSTGNGRLISHEPRTGEQLQSWPIDAEMMPVLVTPGGRQVVLSDRPSDYDSVAVTRATTHIQVRSGATGAIRHDLRIAADLEPEAMSLDEAHLFVLDHRGDHYRVQSLNLLTGERGDLIDRDKNPAEDMRGHSVHGVLSMDHSMLATLYINAEDPEEPAFVHVLNLNGWTYCIDLSAEFAQGPARSQSIERTDDDEIVVRAPAINRAARFDLAELATGDGTPQVQVDLATGSPADAPYRAIPNFEALITTLRG